MAVSVTDDERMAVLRDAQEERYGLGDRCQSKDCRGRAAYLVAWPGQPTRMCERHLDHARAIAKVMGFELQYTISP